VKNITSEKSSYAPVHIAAAALPFRGMAASGTSCFAAIDLLADSQY
jgi:hypothetical protein